MARSPGSDEGHLSYRTLDGEEAHLSRAAIDELRTTLRGGVSLPGDPGFEQARHVWNAMVEHRPALVCHCLSTHDVRNVVQFAHAQDALLSIRGGGHHIAGNAIAEGGIVLDLSRMRSVHVDEDQRRARIEGGALLGDVDHETQAFGLATPLGINSTTGFGGLCLGGGFGWLTRKYGLTIDNLVSAEVVTADGVLHVVSATREPELFWALRGGGGNFGVVTSFEMQLHPVGPMVQAGLVVYPGEQAHDVLRAWRDFTETAPDELAVWVVMRKAPPLPFLAPEVHGKDVLVLAAVYAGELDAGARATEALAHFGTPLGNVLGPHPYAAFQQAFDPLLAPGAQNYWKTNEFSDLDDGVLDAMLEGARAVPTGQCEVFMASLGGAMNRVAVDATAYAGRDARYVMNVHGRSDSATDNGAVRSWARAIFDATSPFATGGGYVNFLTEEEGGRVAAAYGPNYERLQALKLQFDPDNLFRMNHNITPRVGTTVRSARLGKVPSRSPGRAT